MWETDAFVKLINCKMKVFYPQYSKILGNKCEQEDKPEKLTNKQQTKPPQYMVAKSFLNL